MPSYVKYAFSSKNDFKKPAPGYDDNGLSTL